ncbi:hypothetical protein CBR_g8353 [Chara braunii]|uniref:DUF659 domain-containing protein n=1 Tax=Chara braunii TaxID=69332 RepID=A0A388KLW7_CHABU|nr:hypothetical protein CBR_g8353 [Chara braunii]|eukprot:GBG71054.1 hypothetical protein CBR_g8353 [Chara braunii]
MKAAAGSKKRKRKAKMTATEARSAPSQPKKSKVLRQTSMLETFDPVWQQEFSDSLLQWWYVSGIPFEEARRPECHMMRKKLLECPSYAHPALPTYRVISCDGIPQQHLVVADMVVAIRRDIEATGVTILTDGRKSITSDQIVNFLAAGPMGAYLFRTVQRDGAVQETAEADGSDGSLGKREDTIIRARAVVRFIREHGVALSLYRWFSAAHRSSASAAAGSSSSAPPRSQRRGRELVYPVQTRFATHYLMLERLLDRHRALEALMMSDDWLRTAWRRSIFLQARWVRHQVRYAPFWEHVEDIVTLMTPVMQLLRRLDRGGCVMTRMWSSGFVMVDRVARAILNRTSKDELHIHERTLADESLRYLRQQTGGDEDLYQTLRTQLPEFHSRECDWTYGGVEGDRDAASCRGEKETSQVRQWWVHHGDGVPLLQSIAICLTHTWTCASPTERNRAVHERVQVKTRNQLGFIKLTRLVEISTNLRLSRCQGRGSGYVLPWEDAEKETKDAIPPPHDEGVRPADRVTEAQRDRQVQRGRKDRLSKAPPSVETYFGRRATVLMATELESVYDPKPDPMALDAMEAEPWSDPDDLAVESEPGGSDDDDDDTPLIQISRPRTRASTTVAAPSPAARPPSSAPNVSLRGPADRVESTTPHPSTDRRRQGGTRERVDEGDDGDGDDREGYEGSSEDEGDPCYSPMRGHGDDDDDEGGDGGQPVGGLRKSERQRGDRCSGAGRGGSGPGVGGAEHTGGAGHAGRGQVSGSASAEGAGGFAGVGGEGVQVGRPSAQLGASFSDNIFYVSLGFPPTLAGECVGADADAATTPVSQILRGIPSCSASDINSSMLQEAAEGTQGAGDRVRARQDRPRGEEDGPRLASHCEMTQSIASRARVARMLKTGVAAGDAEVECGGAGGGDAGERPELPVQGVCVLPLGGAMSAGELEWQAREDPLQADRRGRMAKASRELMAEGPAFVPCSPSVPSSTTGVSAPAHVEGPGAAEADGAPRRHPLGSLRRTAGTGDHAECSASPRKSMAARILGDDVRAVTAQRSSQASVVWESGTDDLEMPYGQRRRVFVYDLLRPQGGVEAAPQGEIHAPDIAHAPGGGTGRGDGVTGVVPQRRRKHIVDDDDA